jgi:hypothetical protein
MCDTRYFRNSWIFSNKLEFQKTGIWKELREFDWQTPRREFRVIWNQAVVFGHQLISMCWFDDWLRIRHRRVGQLIDVGGRSKVLEGIIKWSPGPIQGNRRIYGSRNRRVIAESVRICRTCPVPLNVFQRTQWKIVRINGPKGIASLSSRISKTLGGFVWQIVHKNGFGRCNSGQDEDKEILCDLLDLNSH